MGYRLYLGSIPRKGMRKYRRASSEALAAEFKDPDDEDCKYFWPPSFPHLKELICLGKYVDFTRGGKYKNFFSFEHPDGEFVVVDKEFLAKVIEEYRSAIHANYVKMHDIMKRLTDKKKMEEVSEEFKNIDALQDYESKDAEAFHCIKERLRRGVFEWGILDGGFIPAYKLDDTGPDEFISTSWSYEYAIFNLIHLYKTFDFKKNYMVYYGH